MKIQDLTTLEWFNNRHKFATADVDIFNNMGTLVIWDGYYINNIIPLQGDVENMCVIVKSYTDYHILSPISQVCVNGGFPYPCMKIRGNEKPKPQEGDDCKFFSIRSQLLHLAYNDIKSGKIKSTINMDANVKTAYGVTTLNNILNEEERIFDSFQIKDGVIRYNSPSYNRNGVNVRPTLINAISYREIFTLK